MRDGSCLEPTKTSWSPAFRCGMQASRSALLCHGKIGSWKHDVSKRTPPWLFRVLHAGHTAWRENYCEVKSEKLWKFLPGKGKNFLFYSFEIQQNTQSALHNPRRGDSDCKTKFCNRLNAALCTIFFSFCFSLFSKNYLHIDFEFDIM